ncbi:type 1 fimbrial protein [Cronobacter universalis]|nr:type 1 fimbrial protein [Cronobacter universalis]
MIIRSLHTVFAAMLMASTAQAMADTQDQPAHLSISGVIAPSVAGCSVSLDKSVVYMQENINRLPMQGNNAVNPTAVMAYISGINPAGQGSVECNDAVKDGHIALKFTGTADSADGTTLANMYNESNGAKGVGIGIFGPTKEPVAINTGLLENLALLPDLRGAIQFNVEMVKLTDRPVSAGVVASALTVQIERL